MFHIFDYPLVQHYVGNSINVKKNLPDKLFINWENKQPIF